MKKNKTDKEGKDEGPGGGKGHEEEEEEGKRIRKKSKIERVVRGKLKQKIC